jgi:hypothetical protein
MSRYAGTIQLRQYLATNGNMDTGNNGLLQECLDRAESIIDDYTRRTFAGTAGTRYYSRFDGAQRVRGQAFWLETDLHTLTGLTLGNGQDVPVGSVWLETRNLPPYRVLRLKSQYVYTWNTDTDMIVSGTWGYGTVAPETVVQATVRYAAYLYRQKDVTPQDMISMPETGGAPVFPAGIPSDVRLMLNPYRRVGGGAV